MKIVPPMTVDVTALVSINTTDGILPAWSSSTYYTAGQTVGKTVSGIPRIYQSVQGSNATVTMTIASPAVISWAAHGLNAGDPVAFTNSGGALPTGITSGQIYYVRDVALDSFSVSATQGGAAVNASGTQSGTHTGHGNPNKGNDPNLDTTGTYWLYAGVSLSWKMFDQSVQSQTTNADSIDVIIRTNQRVDTVVLLNVSAASVEVKMTDDTDGVVFDQTFSLVSDSGITDWYDYYFDPIVRDSRLVVEGLPPYSNALVEVKIIDTGNIVACGECVFGLARDIGGTQYGASVGITDYSVKEADTFGNFSILERAFARRGSFTVKVDNDAIDEVTDLLASYRATPVVYIGADDFSSTVVYGYYKDFDAVIQYLEFSVLSIELEGLT